jgi:hypothetical protein
MAWELLNWVDGRRTGLDIYHSLRAEALEAGVHYFGRVSDTAVLQYLKNAVSAGMVKQ